ncbi:hypothetical protein F7725_014980, partial [Dissostichus mawsoni]
MLVTGVLCPVCLENHGENRGFPVRAGTVRIQMLSHKHFRTQRKTRGKSPQTHWDNNDLLFRCSVRVLKCIIWWKSAENHPVMMSTLRVRDGRDPVRGCVKRESFQMPETVETPDLKHIYPFCFPRVAAVIAAAGDALFPGLSLEDLTRKDPENRRRAFLRAASLQMRAACP